MNRENSSVLFQNQIEVEVETSKNHASSICIFSTLQMEKDGVLCSSILF